ncbi:MAG: ribosomal-protein-alanine N-acetyltransferase [Erysipelotrichaceae bacterium]|nr:ribosomal-protein-alanine N-acetyltransferase [Erysipelotrichaceae bacterium]
MQFINVEIRKMEERDLPAVMEIENLCFVAPWSKENFLNEMDNQYANLWVIELSAEGTAKQVVGFSDYWQTFDSATICQIAVHPGIRRRQLGSALMDEIINDCYAKRVQNLTLEVRKSNQIAINFYKKHGFKETLVKEKYYSNGEDAIYMMRGVDIDG